MARYCHLSHVLLRHNRGEAALRNLLLEDSVAFHDWLKATEGQTKQQGKTTKPPARRMALYLAPNYEGLLTYNTTDAKWYRYISGAWRETTDNNRDRLISQELDKRLDGNYGQHYLNDVVSQLRIELGQDEWKTPKNLLPFGNGVLNLETRELQPHSPENWLTWGLPYGYDPLATCGPIQDWLLESTQGDKEIVEVLRAYLNAIIKSRTDLQRYLELVGPGGSGKSSFLWLAEALVGQENTVTTELKQLENNRFETANIYGKRLALITDSERYGGGVSVLKAITGQDKIRYERKNVQQNQGFVAEAMVIVAANEAVQSSDYTSGLSRRRLTVPFRNQVAANQRRDLRREFIPLLPGLINWVLEMPDAKVTRLITDTERYVPSLAAAKAETLTETNPLADWFNNNVVHEPGTKAYVGTKSDTQKLYGSYCQHVEETNNRPVSYRRFSGLLIDLGKSQLHLDVAKGQDRSGVYLNNIRLRSAEDDVVRPITDGPMVEMEVECEGCEG